MDSIKQLDIFYFSGTGNAKQIALWFSEQAMERGISCNLTSIDSIGTKNIPVPSTDTLLILISPVHGFSYPKIMLDFIARFPKGNSKVVLMNTRAGMRLGRFVTPGLSGVSFFLSSFLLRRKGYRIVGQIPFDMPSNWLALHPALGKRTVSYLFQKNHEKVRKHADKIFFGKKDFLARKDVVQDVLISPIALAYYLAGRFVFAKTLYANSACNVCGLCEKVCPVQAIKMRKRRPFWTFKCESCMRCINRCPTRAIEVAHGLLAVLALLSLLITGLLYKLALGSVSSEWISFALSNLVFFVLLAVLYKLQHLLLKNRLIVKIITLSSLTHYKFWGRYKFTPRG